MGHVRVESERRRWQLLNAPPPKTIPHLADVRLRV